MKHTDFEFNGKTYALSFTAEALFSVYDKFGMEGNILESTKALEPTQEGWKNCCWLLALMASQGELQRRHMGQTPQPMLEMEEIRTGMMAVDIPYVQRKVREALEQGFRREITPEEETQKEINLVLQAREEATKKAKLLARSVLGFLRQQLPTSISESKKRSS